MKIKTRLQLELMPRVGQRLVWIDGVTGIVHRICVVSTNSKGYWKKYDFTAALEKDGSIFGFNMSDNDWREDG